MPSDLYGAAMDNPDLTVACLVGDGEAETGPTAGAWHLNKLLNPRKDGVVLPILHLNGYKISAPTVFGRMSNYELMTLFSGYGYEPRIVDATKDGVDPHDEMANALEWAHNLVAEIRASTNTEAPRMPMIIMRTLKGWTGPKFVEGNKIEGNCLAHQTVLSEAKSDPEQLKILNQIPGRRILRARLGRKSIRSVVLSGQLSGGGRNAVRICRETSGSAARAGIPFPGRTRPGDGA